MSHQLINLMWKMQRRVPRFSRFARSGDFRLRDQYEPGRPRLQSCRKEAMMFPASAAEGMSAQEDARVERTLLSAAFAVGVALVVALIPELNLSFRTK
jgi:hypothetical protein